MAAKNAVVFSGRNGLDFSELRTGVLRIPEVTARIREAQRVLDSQDLANVDLLSVIGADDEFFFRNIKLKSLAAAIVQVGLFDRLLRTQRRPTYLIGNSNGDSAMMVCAGQITFEELVSKSAALETLASIERVVVPFVAEPAPLLSGITLTEYRALKHDTDLPGQTTYSPVRDGVMDLKKIVTILHVEENVNRFVNIGPSSALRSSDYKNLGSDEVESIDSIELDPMLSWFWQGVRLQALALAQ